MRLDVEPASGRGFLTGDAVNTAARLEAAAPPGGVAVGALTHELTRRVIEYEAAAGDGEGQERAGGTNCAARSSIFSEGSARRRHRGTTGRTGAPFTRDTGRADL